MLKKNIPRKKIALVGAGLLLAIVAFFVVGHNKTEAPNQAGTNASSTNKKQDETKKTTQDDTEKPAEFNTSQYSIDQPGSPWWIVNKKRALPSGYAPESLVNPAVALRLGGGAQEMHIRSDVAPSVEKMFADAASAGHALLFASGYRSEAMQTQLYNNYVRMDGQAAADRYSAKPGTSEHQTGMAFDVCLQNSGCDLVESFGQTPAGIWIADNAHKYGFIVRYLPGKESITGYMYEPWHLRYIGTELATKLRETGQTMEEFFGL